VYLFLLCFLAFRGDKTRRKKSTSTHKTPDEKKKERDMLRRKSSRLVTHATKTQTIKEPEQKEKTLEMCLIQREEMKRKNKK